MSEAEQIAELRKALETLVKLHKNWDKGTAYVPGQFMHDNNAAISAARDILRQTVPTAPPHMRPKPPSRQPCSPLTPEKLASLP